MRVSSRKSAEIGAFAHANARNEERHWMLLTGVPRHGFLRNGQVCAQLYCHGLEYNEL